ncbi:MAG: 30S ribosomal protein S3ae [Candidatus Diapherotrites archaeon]|nr:30S ribosomal protein S3ae [Candidatus Diapherotrites archaeon]
MARKRKKKVDTWKAKKWYSIVAPGCFNEKELGETPVAEAESLVGRTIKMSLGEITEKRSQYQTSLIFQVYKVEGNKAYTEIRGHEIKRGYIGRLSKRMRSVVRTIFNVETKDKKIVQMQTICLAKVKMDREQKKAIRETVIEVATKEAKKTNLDKFFQEVVFGKISTEIFAKVKKIFPVIRMEITKTKVTSETND